MDLAVHGRTDLRREVLQAWLETSGDFAAVALLPYFELYRALVRAKVAALRGQQARNTAAGTTGAATLAHQYLDWAVSRIRRPRPRLVVMVGLSGSGKTWLARRIAERLEALIVRSDIERKRLAGLQPLDARPRRPTPASIRASSMRAPTSGCASCAADCLRGNESVIVDAANLRRGERELFLEAGGNTQPESRSFTALRRSTCSSDAWPNGPPPAPTPRKPRSSLLDRQPSYWEPFSGDELGYVVAVDTTSPDRSSVRYAAWPRRRARATTPARRDPRARWRAARGPPPRSSPGRNRRWSSCASCRAGDRRRG